MNNDFLLQGYDIARIPYKLNEPVAKKSTFKVGSTAAVFVIPESLEQFLSATGAAKASDEKFFILGGGSNIVFPDEEYDGLIISTEKLNNILMTDDELPENLPEDSILVTCQAGTPMSAFVNFCTKHNLSGVEQFAGLPGTVGGAVYMNARCFEKSISDILFQTDFFEVYDRGRTKSFSAPYDKTQWDYKKSPFQPSPDSPMKVITSATFVLRKIPSPNNIDSECKKYISERIDKGHFKFPSAGSVFKNNHSFGKPSGKIIDEAGLRGTKIGGAQIAPFHGNFIINVDNAKAKDIKDLVSLIQDKVFSLYGYKLEPEIIFI